MVDSARRGHRLDEVAHRVVGIGVALTAGIGRGGEPVEGVVAEGCLAQVVGERGDVAGRVVGVAEREQIGAVARVRDVGGPVEGVVADRGREIARTRDGGHPIGRVVAVGGRPPGPVGDCLQSALDVVGVADGAPAAGIAHARGTSRRVVAIADGAAAAGGGGEPTERVVGVARVTSAVGHRESPAAPVAQGRLECRRMRRRRQCRIPWRHSARAPGCERMAAGTRRRGRLMRMMRSTSPKAPKTRKTMTARKA